MPVCSQTAQIAPKLADSGCCCSYCSVQQHFRWSDNSQQLVSAGMCRTDHLKQSISQHTLHSTRKHVVITAKPSGISSRHTGHSTGIVPVLTACTWDSKKSSDFCSFSKSYYFFPHGIQCFLFPTVCWLHLCFDCIYPTDKNISKEWHWKFNHMQYPFHIACSHHIEITVFCHLCLEPIDGRFSDAEAR